MRRPLRWELAPAEALRLVRDDAHPVALFGTWAGGADVVAAEPASVRSGPARWRTSSTSRCRRPADGPSPTRRRSPTPPRSAPPSPAAGSGTWATARAARRSPRPGRAGCPRGGSAGTTTCWCASGRRGSGSSRRCGRTPARPRSNAATRTWSPGRPSRRRPPRLRLLAVPAEPGRGRPPASGRAGGGVHPRGRHLPGQHLPAGGGRVRGRPPRRLLPGGGGTPAALRRLHRRLRRPGTAGRPAPPRRRRRPRR